MPTTREPMTLPAPAAIRLLAVLMTCVFSGLGILHMVTAHAEERWTKFGHTAAMDGPSAIHFGITGFFFGLLPLALAAPSPRWAKVIAAGAVACGFTSLLFGLFL